MSNTRRQWETAVRTDQSWPSTCRVVRGTLLALAAEMRPDGVIRYRPRDVLAARVGLPERTLNRHLARAVDLGWLNHRRAQRHVTAEYRAAIPAVSGCHEWQAENPSLDATHSCAENPSLDATWWPAHIDRASVSERVAVDKDRERRDHHDGARALGEHDESKSRGEAQNSTTPVPVAAAALDSPPTSAPANVNPRPAVLGRALEPAPYESGPPTGGQSCRWCSGEMNPRTGRCLDCRNRTYLVAVSA